MPRYKISYIAYDDEAGSFIEAAAGLRSYMYESECPANADFEVEWRDDAGEIQRKTVTSDDIDKWDQLQYEEGEDAEV